jgi:hypothetical protein
MHQSSENKQWMYTGDYADALNEYVDGLSNQDIVDLLKDFIWDYMETSMTNEQIQYFIDNKEW